MVQNSTRPTHDLSKLKIDSAARTRSRRISWAAPAGGALIIAAAITAVLLLRTPTVAVGVSAARYAESVEAIPVLNASGYVTPRQRATVAAKITGRVEAMLVEEGMPVQPGQILARLDSTDALAMLRAAEAELQVSQTSINDLTVQLEDARRTLRRLEQLKAEGIASVEALDRARTAVDSLNAKILLAEASVQAARSRVAVARQDVENCSVFAPFAGIVVSKDAQVGEMVSPISAGGGFTRTGIATLVDMDSLEIEVDVNESHIAKISTGQKVTATLDAYPDWHIPATVRTIIPTADRQRATVKVRITFDETDPRILPDMGVKVSFLHSRDTLSGRDSLIIKRTALRQSGGATVVYLLEGGRIVERAVQVGEFLGDEVEITSGIASGDLVVTDGPAQLRDGQRAVVKP
jgi:RND family efflux transporter MFP subunit